MISKEEDKLIINYLVNKRLSYDLMSEVYDHMTTQIHELRTNENMSFEEAWQKVQFTWIDELIMTYDVRFSLDDISILAKKIITQRNRRSIPRSIGLGILLSTVFFLAFAWIPQSEIMLTQIIFCGSFLVLAVFFLIRTSQLKKKNSLQLKDTNPLTQYEGIMAIPSATGGAIAFFSSTERWEKMHSLLNSLLFQSGNLNSANYGFMLFVWFFLALYMFALTYFYFGFKEYQKAFGQAIRFKKKVEEVLI